MPTFSAASKVRLASCDPRLQVVVTEAIKHVDFSVDVGHRPKAEQDKAVAEGRSQKLWPLGEHNALPSRACDLRPIVPDTLDIWEIQNPVVQLYWWKLVYAMLRAAELHGVKIRWGNDWNSDGDIMDTKLKDWPHFELS